MTLSFLLNLYNINFIWRLLIWWQQLFYQYDVWLRIILKPEINGPSLYLLCLFLFHSDILKNWNTMQLLLRFWGSMKFAGWGSMIIIISMTYENAIMITVGNDLPWRPLFYYIKSEFHPFFFHFHLHFVRFKIISRCNCGRKLSYNKGYSTKWSCGGSRNRKWKDQLWIFRKLCWILGKRSGSTFRAICKSTVTCCGALLPSYKTCTRTEFFDAR